MTFKTPIKAPSDWQEGAFYIITPENAYITPENAIFFFFTSPTASTEWL
jgi:hypothetical protein